MQRSGDQFLARTALPPHQHAARGAGHSADFRFQFPHLRAIADQLAEGGRFIDQPLIIGFQTALPPRALQCDYDDVGQRNRKIEIVLTETALIEIAVYGAQSNVVDNERHAQGIGVMPQAVGLRAAALLGDPHRMALPAHQFGERIAQFHAVGRALGNHQFRFQPAAIVAPQESDDRCPGLLLQ